MIFAAALVSATIFFCYQMGASMEEQTLWIVAVVGAGALAGVFWKMKPGFGPFNLRAMGIVLIALFTVLLAIENTGTLNAAMGILGAIAGYLFSVIAESESNSSAVDASGSSFGDGARVAGRDINETVNNINAQVQELGKLLSDQKSKIDRIYTSESGQTYEYLVNTVYTKQLNDIAREMNIIVNRWESEGWRLLGMSADYQGMDGIFLLFRRPATDGLSTVRFHHGVNSSPV